VTQSLENETKFVVGAIRKLEKRTREAIELRIQPRHPMHQALLPCVDRIGWKDLLSADFHKVQQELETCEAERDRTVAALENVAASTWSREAQK
jgi:hypothetical protein